MSLARYALPMLLAAATLRAGTVDVSSAQTALVSGGYTISFELFTGSYSSAAQQFGLSPTPDLLQFALATTPLDTGQEFSATLRSTDASILVSLGNLLDFTSGYMSSVGFQGAVSTLQGQFHLDSQAQNLFLSGTVWLDLTNLGGDLTLGLPQLPLSHDLYASLSGGPLTVGATTGSVLLEQPTRLLSPKGLHAAGVTLIPEPGSYWLLIGGAGVLLAFYSVRTHLTRARD